MFLGEDLHNPFFKPSDIFLADYITALINQINALDYDIFIKVTLRYSADNFLIH